MLEACLSLRFQGQPGQLSQKEKGEKEKKFPIIFL
jgi:hypothetical protein